MIRRSSLTVSGSSCSSSEGKSSGWRPIQAPTYRFGGSVTLASRRSRKGELETCFEHSLNVLSHKAKTQSNKLSLYNYTCNNGPQCVSVVLSHSRRREFCKRLRCFRMMNSAFDGKVALITGAGGACGDRQILCAAAKCERL